MIVGRTHAEISKAYAKPCPHSCQHCLRSCTAASSYTHRFDCCGEVVAHAMQNPARGPMYVAVITNPMRAGYATGPSTTQPKGTVNASLF